MPNLPTRCDDHRALLSSSPREASASASACASAICSMARRSVLSSIKLRRDFWRPSETSPSKQQPDLQDRRAPIRPPALMRGPSIKPRCQASGGLLRPCNIHQCGMTDMIRDGPHRDQAFRHESPIEPDQRARHIGDRAKRHVVAACPSKSGSGISARPKSSQNVVRGLTATSVIRNESHCGEMAESRQIIGPVRIHQSINFRQFVATLMVDR